MSSDITVTGGTVEEVATIPEGRTSMNENGAQALAALLSEGVDTVITHIDPDVDAVVSCALLHNATGAKVEFRSANDPVEGHEVGVVGVDVKDGQRSFKGIDESGNRGSAACLVIQALGILGCPVSEVESMLVTIADEVDRAVRRSVAYGFMHLLNGIKDLGVPDGLLIELTTAIIRRDPDALLVVVNRLAGAARTGPNQGVVSFGVSTESEFSAAVALAEFGMAARLVVNERYEGALARRSDQTIVNARRSKFSRDLRSALRDGRKIPDAAKRQAMVDAITDESGELQVLLAFAPPKVRVRLLALALLGPSRVAPAERRSWARIYAALDELNEDCILVIDEIERPRATKGAKRLRAVRDAGVLFVIRHGIDGSTRVDSTACGSAWLESHGLTFANFAEAVLPDVFHIEDWGAVCGSTKAWTTPPVHDHAEVRSALRSAISLLEEAAA